MACPGHRSRFGHDPPCAIRPGVRRTGHATLLDRRARMAYHPAMRTLAAMAGLLAACAALFASLLIRFPYDGLYGQDAYAYYYQALALWREISGQPPAPGALFDAHALRWPLGYHLQLILGYLLSGDAAGGRALTLLLACLAPALLYLILREIRREAPGSRQVIAGLIGGGLLVLTGTYARMGLSVMADVPALFWSLLAVYCALRAWPPRRPRGVSRRCVASRLGRGDRRGARPGGAGALWLGPAWRGVARVSGAACLPAR